MLVYYCAKCQRQNPGAACSGCGKTLPSTAARYVWSDYGLAIHDPARIGSVLRVMFFAVMVLLLGMAAVEYIFSGPQVISFLTETNILPILVAVFFGGAALGFLLLALQGGENVQYAMDPKGVLKRTWITPSRLKCAARFLRYDPRAFQNNSEGVPFLMAHEEYLVWQDAARYVLHPRSGRINLYRPSSFLFMGMHIPREEYDGAAAMVAAKLKKRR